MVLCGLAVGCQCCHNGGAGANRPDFGDPVL